MHVASVNVLKQYLPDSYNTKFLCPQFVSQMGPWANETTVSSRTVKVVRGAFGPYLYYGKMSPTTTGIPYLYQRMLAVNTAQEFDNFVRESMLLCEEYPMLVELWNTNLAGPEMDELVGVAWATIIAAPHDFLACMFRLADADNMRIFLQLGRLTRAINNPSYLYWLKMLDHVPDLGLCFFAAVLAEPTCCRIFTQFREECKRLETIGVFSTNSARQLNAYMHGLNQYGTFYNGRKIDLLATCRQYSAGVLYQVREPLPFDMLQKIFILPESTQDWKVGADALGVFLGDVPYYIKSGS
ncbi:hypothetical protein SARC_02296 [Sphaeroforma arctica JP610]|uniref:Uncharacterized protein n=1 Tax=Sphaeroforma arctica JP610 TaxID=667725 RepID=A0A0L0G960_9EUKA|nr:hypothetical protein SARC_02296 [Sphaeroforma arctica JP610]KNC85535.1 hypothetical protein SARC_02296 [Sphaeroforma arctica JP610]|eukprot:XP_014159437.1 hypothetical protein SARC_02296 [Sphaeroforma arctica JP610]